ncbi:MAG: glutamate--tRNA ligase [Actinobacteria bacterium]|nr:glutamate--tRNA ligase [Actinomycetota bacterium]MCL5447063.1 glutamate--tRNA ligase [Actinomycetota bacterium]
MDTNTSPRVRFAPSPTGYFHVGSARTALFNWLFARRNHGTFILRIEDTDEERGREEWVSGILSALAWLGLEYDEGPYRQSERSALHADALTRLWDGGYLYACGCNREEVLERTKGNQTPGYDGHCRELGLAREGRALRFRTPRDGITVVKDVVRGLVEFPHRAMEDFVVSKANGSPLFVLANVVDDIDMGITHVIRGEDLLPSTPKGILLWKALEGSAVELPVFAHLPMLVNEKRQKLSKRRDPVSLEYFSEQGYLPEAFCNYLSLLGWSHPSGKELMTMEEIIQSFSLEDINHSPAFFDVVKLTHMNGEHIRLLDADVFAARSSAWLDTAPVPWARDHFDMDTYRRIAHIVQERVATLAEIIPMVDFFFLESPIYDQAAIESLATNDTTRKIVTMALDIYSRCTWAPDALHEATAAMGNEIALKLSRAQAPVRVAVTGKRVGPPLFESMAILGRERVLARLHAFAALVARTTPE